MAREPWRTGIVLVAAAAVSVLTIQLGISGGSTNRRAVPYAKLVFDAASDDRAIVSSLAAGGFRDVISESTQWVILDDFGDGERIALDRYRDRVESFDPRDDGYAEKLRAVFLSGGKRFVYVRRPFVSVLSGSAASFERELRGALAESSFTVASDASPSSFPMPRAVAALACLALGAFFTKSFAKTLLALPSTVSLAVWGPAGFIAAGFLYAAFLSFFPSIRELSRIVGGFSSKRGNDRATLDAVKRERGWEFESIPISAILTISSLVLSILGGVPRSCFAAAFGAAALCAASQLRVAKVLADRRGHARFAPLSLRPALRASLARAFRGVLPFSLAAAVLLVAALAAGAFAPAAAEPPAGERVTMVDYRAHLERQNSFRTTNLFAPRAEEGFPGYKLDASGLAVPSSASAAPNALKTELPPAERYLIGPSRGAEQVGVPFAGLVPDLVAVLCSLAVSLPVSFAAGLFDKRTKVTAESAEKRIAA